MPGGIITNRPLQNKVTGIDLYVPLYKEIRGSMITGHVEYQIIVVTCLAAFKSLKHRPGDVVQFVVSKKYSEIYDLYHCLITKYPNIHLPSVPRKTLFVGETDLRERRTAFDELVKFISKHPMLANCQELMDFLGAPTMLSDVKTTNKPDCLDNKEEDGLDFFGREPSSFMSVTEKISNRNVKQLKPLEEGELFNPLGSKRKCINPGNGFPVSKSVADPKTLFDADDDSDKELFISETADVKLFEDLQLKRTDNLMLSYSSNNSNESTDSKMDDETDELFRVEENLEKLFTVRKMVKQKVKAKPVLSKKSSSLPQTTKLQQSQTEAMYQMDIVKYIQQNDVPASEELDLFYKTPD